MSSVSTLLAISPLAALVYFVGRFAVQCLTLLAGLLIALRGTTESGERVKAYIALTKALTVVCPRPSVRSYRR